MKRFNFNVLVYGVAVSVLLFTACTEVENDKLEISPRELKFNAIGDVAKVSKVITNVLTWTFEKSAEWFNVRQDDDNLIVTVDEYVEADDSRFGTITVIAGEAPPVTVNVEQFGKINFEKSGGVVLNPGQGWILYGLPGNQSAATIALGTTGYDRFDWGQINPSENEYNWTPIDNAIARWAAHGKQFAFGVMSVNTFGSAYCTPKWVFDKGAQYTMGNAESGSAERNVYIPVWDDPIYVEECAKFAAKLAERYDGDPNVAFIDIRNYGNWGEMHMYPFDRWSKRLTTSQLQTLLIQPYVDNFNSTQLMMCCVTPPYLENNLNHWAVDNGVGLRMDGIMGNPIAGITNYNGENMYMAIGRKPIAWEFHDGFVMPWDDNRFMNNIKTNKPNYIGMGNFGGNAQYMLRQKPELVREVANLMGYNLSMTTATYTNSIAVGQAQEISLSIENSGVTNMLTGCIIKLVLLDDNNNVVSSFTTDWDAKSIQGTSTSEFKANVVFDDVPAENYKLAIGLYRNENSQKPTYNMDNKLRTQDGFYIIGVLKIVN